MTKRLGTIKDASQYYSNILVLSKDGQQLATISSKRAKWYLNKNLATEILPSPSPYPRTIQLNFAHKTPAASRKGIDTLVCDTHCVMCGKTTELTLHHVIPHVIKRYFPINEKEHTREWCVLLCEKCHVDIENKTQFRYRQDFPKTPLYMSEKDVDMYKLQKLKHYGHTDTIPPDRLKALIANAGVTSLDEISPFYKITRRNKHKNTKILHRDAIKIWALNFIESKGGILGVKQFFKDMFLSFEPKFLPKEFLWIEM